MKVIYVSHPISQPSLSVMRPNITLENERRGREGGERMVFHCTPPLRIFMIPLLVPRWPSNPGEQRRGKISAGIRSGFVFAWRRVILPSIGSYFNRYAEEDLHISLVFIFKTI